MSDVHSLPEIILHGSNISYFTGKMENYFRVRDIPYELRAMQFPGDKKKLEKQLGVMQLPSVQMSDGRWMTDSTKMIEWFEAQLPGEGIVPADPLQAFVCLLLEDWADEWWWRPAMHYRWHYAEGARFASWHLATELMGSHPAPVWIKRRMLCHRQRSGYTTGDGINVANVAAVEADFMRLLDQLQRIFSKRPFIFGDRPSLADIGFSGPFFRHFALDPVPLEIIRQEAPAVLEWVARLWNTRLEDCAGQWLDGIPDDLGPLLDEIGNAYLPYLCANVDAVNAGHKRFDVQVAGVQYSGARISRYRVWCLDQLRTHFNALPEPTRKVAKELLASHACWEPLWRQKQLPLLPGQEQQLPFRADTKMLSVNN